MIFWQAVPCREIGRTLGGPRSLWHDAESQLVREPIFSDLVPSLVELALVMIGPVLRRMNVEGDRLLCLHPFDYLPLAEAAVALAIQAQHLGQGQDAPIGCFGGRQTGRNRQECDGAGFLKQGVLHRGFLPQSFDVPMRKWISQEQPE
ncbi:hypothetical protein RGQ15_15225 [Paracoccus sp. MBLB3053]|uniref:Uncharacterized protein n=1 Tax=Paracoccus aurantius TaxID=3073814 RepID=A0ABU2HW08_9RHOB|nr:hypothetical protein [Paracoccus sp. MBLB3053]MDS9468917.1 hypothetical protein [Paracoccus sp. MBLB3053]